jgi:tRNA(fMet)-specific endonuclease VapC
MVVLDTDHLSLLERPQAGGAKLSVRLAQIEPSEIATTIVTYEEQTRGWLAYHARSKDINQQVATYARLKLHLESYRSIVVLDFDEAAATEYQRLRRLRIRIGTLDLKIAAITIRRDATLLTRNFSDFRRIPGLRAEDWTT